MNILATWHYRSAHGLPRAVSGLNYALPLRVDLGAPGGLDLAILKTPSSI
jgi:hypothetical protein